MMGEITPRIAEAVGSAAAKKVLLPVSQNHFEIVGVEPEVTGFVSERGCKQNFDFG